MTSMAVKQIEFYFTVENLCKDIFIRSYMDEEVRHANVLHVDGKLTTKSWPQSLRMKMKAEKSSEDPLGRMPRMLTFITSLIPLSVYDQDWCKRVYFESQTHFFLFVAQRHATFPPPNSPAFCPCATLFVY